MARYVTLVNRTSKILTGTWDGKRMAIYPGKNSFPESLAEKFKQQHPVMGSEDPYTLDKIFLLGIEENNDDCSPMEQSDAVERFDRSKIPGGDKAVEVVKGRTGIYSRNAPDFASLPSDEGFVKP